MPQPSQRVEVLVDAPLISRIASLAEAAGIAHHMVVATMGGTGPHGRWRRDEVTGTTAKQLFIANTTAERAAALIEALRPLLESHDLLITCTTVDVLGAP